MAMTAFFTRFRELAFKEMRSATVQGGRDLPDGEYGFLELYCDEVNCDCRRVIINVVTPKTSPKVLATINYGWESLEFYEKWMHDKELAKNSRGATLDMLNPQSKHAYALLELFKWVLQDDQYVERLKRHYALFKGAIHAEHQARKQRTIRQKRNRRKR
ncbi:MAG: hypothetical protein HY782_21695 [Chloroflexi bacterium]|nr:hypothetical protein [Chloroflexota bacterium]